MSNNRPLVSVILPNYNNGPYLEEAINSILNQSYQNFEFIIIDDCSTDNSVNIIESYSDSRIVLKVKEGNSGIVDALNIGLDIAKGGYMLRMDGDDVSTPNRLEKLLEYMNNNPEIGVCSSAIQNFGLINDLWLFESDPYKNKAHILFGHGIGHASSIFRLDLFRDNSIKYRNDYPFVEDYKLFSELNELTMFGSVPEAFYHYRRLENSSTLLNQNTLRQRQGLVHKELLFNLLGRVPTPGELYIHFNLYRGIFDKPLIDYYHWSENLIEANKKKEIYPHEVLQIVVEQKLEKIKFKALDSSFVNFWRIIKYDRRLNIRYFRYLISTLLKTQ